MLRRCAAVAVLLVAACRRPPERSAAAPAPPPRSVLPGPYRALSGLATPRRLVVRDAAAWRALWAEMQRDRQDPAGLPPAPPVDFGREMLLVAALGTRSDGGPSVAIEGVRPTAESLYVWVRITAPGRGCLAPLEVSTPADVVRVPRSDLPARFVDHTVVRDCE